MGRNSEETVRGERVCSVDGDETIRVGGHAHRSIQGSETTVIGGSEQRLVHGGTYQITLTNGGHRIEANTELIHRQGRNVLAMVGADDEGEEGVVGLYSPYEIRLEAGETHAVSDADAESGVDGSDDSTEARIRLLPEGIEMKVGRSIIEIRDDHIRVNNKIFPA